MTCRPCRRGCKHCSNFRDCIEDRSSYESTIIALAIFGVTIAILVVFFLWKRFCRNNSAVELWNTSNNKLLYKSTFNSLSMSKEEYVLPADAIKEPLLPTEDSPSSDDEGSKSNVFPWNEKASNSLDSLKILSMEFTQDSLLLIVIVSMHLLANNPNPIQS